MDKSNVILETVKQAENGDGTILRLYESENARTRVRVNLPNDTKQVFVTNLLEETEIQLPVTDHSVSLVIKPFEIVTLLIK